MKICDTCLESIKKFGDGAQADSRLEQKLLSALLQFPSECRRVFHWLGVSDFSDENNAMLFGAIMTAWHVRIKIRPLRRDPQTYTEKAVPIFPLLSDDLVPYFEEVAAIEGEIDCVEEYAQRIKQKSIAHYILHLHHNANLFKKEIKNEN